MKNFLILILSVSLIGCAYLSGKQKPFSQPQYGMSKQQLIGLLGSPERIEIYKKTDLTRVEFYIYFRNNQSSQTEIPVCLIDDSVVGWGKTYYEDHISADDIRIR